VRAASAQNSHEPGVLFEVSTTPTVTDPTFGDDCQVAAISGCADWPPRNENPAHPYQVEASQHVPSNTLPVIELPDGRMIVA